jgi:hypothetical protein
LCTVSNGAQGGESLRAAEQALAERRFFRSFPQHLGG